MKKIIILFAILILALFLLGCDEWMGPPPNYKDIEGARLPVICEGAKGDACETFACMIDYCECISSPDRVFMEAPGGLFLENEGQVESWVNSAIMAKVFSGDSAFKEITDWEITDVIKMNDIFYRVTIDYGNGVFDDLVVAIDGEIIETICMV